MKYLCFVCRYRVKADKMLADLSSIALEWAKNYVRQRQTFKLNTKGENMAPLAFQHDPDGAYHDLAVQIRNLDLDIFLSEEDGPSFEPVDDEGEGEEKRAESRTPVTLTRDDLPSRPSARTTSRSASRTRLVSPERKEARVFKTQKEIITAWIEDPDHPANDACRYPLELYAQLNDSEFAYVS